MPESQKVLYYVTNEGLAAALSNPDIADTMRGVIVGAAHPQTTRSFHKRGFISPDRRGASRTDHNTLLLTGAVERVREVLLHASPTGGPAPGGESAATAPATAPEPPRPRAFTRYAVAPELPMPAISPTCQQVLTVMREHPEGLTFAELHDALPGVNEGTLRWAVQELRRKRLALNDSDRAGLAIAS